MARKRFTPEETALLTMGARVEWQNGRHWHPATVTGEITRDRDGWEGCMLTNHGQTAGLSAGCAVTGTPGHVRASSYVGLRAATATVGVNMADVWRSPEGLTAEEQWAKDTGEIEDEWRRTKARARADAVAGTYARLQTCDGLADTDVFP